MKKYLKQNWKFLLLLLIGGLIGGYCLGLYGYDSLSEDLLKQLQEQNVTREMVVIYTMIQYGILYGVLLGSIGIVISKKIKLWNEFKIDKKANEQIAIYKDVHEGLISSKTSKIPVYVIPTNEELMIIKDTYELINK